MSRATEDANRRLLRARDAMDHAYAEPLDIAALARIAYLSEAYVIRSFRATFGETPHRYLQRRRVERAMFLLRSTDRSVTEICLETGFTSLGTFSRTFRAIVGEPPFGAMRWLTVRVPGEDRLVLLERPGPPGYDPTTTDSIREMVTKGASGGHLFFYTDDAYATHADLKAKDVELPEEPTDRATASTSASATPSAITCGSPSATPTRPDRPRPLTTPQHLQRLSGRCWCRGVDLGAAECEPVGGLIHRSPARGYAGRRGSTALAAWMTSCSPRPSGPRASPRTSWPGSAAAVNSPESAAAPTAGIRPRLLVVTPGTAVWCWRRRHCCMTGRWSVTARRQCSIDSRCGRSRSPRSTSRVVAAGRASAATWCTSTAPRCPRPTSSWSTGVVVTSLARTVLDLGRTRPMEQAVAAGDAALRSGLSPATLGLGLLAMERCPGVRAARRAVDFLDARSESPGESVSRVRMHLDGLPAPELQQEILGPGGQVIARLDFLWREQGVAGEFDGKVKYGRLLSPGQSVEEVVFAEKVREDRVRDEDLRMVRWIWPDLYQRWVLRDRVLRAFERRR